jgi:hypothetical protein
MSGVAGVPAGVSEQRANGNRIVREHIEISLQELINRQPPQSHRALNGWLGKPTGIGSVQIHWSIPPNRLRVR